jgi:hypothetical protein
MTKGGNEMSTDTMPRTPGTPRQEPARRTPDARTMPPRPKAPNPPNPPKPSKARKPAKAPKPAKAQKPSKAPKPSKATAAPAALGRVRPARPVSAPRHTRPATGPTVPVAGRPAAVIRPRARTPRAPFILLLVGLLGGALVSLLVISTTLAQGAFQITNLQQENANLARQEQTLTNQVAQEGNPAVIAKEAEQFGMRQNPYLRFVDTKTGKIVSGKVSKADAEINVPGYNP